jgi:hypothetical protein
MDQKSPSRKFLDACVRFLAVTIVIVWGALAYQIAAGNRLFF